MRRILVWAAIAAIGATSFVAAVAPAGSSTRTPSERATAIAKQLRCPVCQGLSVADSSSPSAEGMRADIGRRIAAGQDDATIRAAYVARYGEWILLRPRPSGLGAIAWAAPAGAAAAATVGLMAAFRRRRRDRVDGEVSSEAASVVAAEMARSAAERGVHQ